MIPRWDILSIRWRNRPLTTAEYLTFSKEVLHVLAEFDPMFKKIVLLGKELTKPDAPDFENRLIEQINMIERVYQNPDPANQKLTMASTSWFGFDGHYMINTEGGTGARLTITAGAPEDWPCLINLKFSRTFHPEFYEHNFMQALIKLLIEFCNPTNAFVISHPFWNQIELPPREDEINSRVEPVGWFTYLANPRANALLPADVQREILPGGGVLISLQQAFPSEDDPAAVAAAIRIRDALQTEDLLRL